MNALKLGAGKLSGNCGKVNFGFWPGGKTQGRKGLSGLTLSRAVGYL
jgi:hypothetical protein